MCLVGSWGIQPYFKPARYDQSSAFSAFQVHMIQPWPFSYEIVCASQNLRRKVLYWEVKWAPLPLLPAHDPLDEEPCLLPSYRAPTPRPLRYLAQSVLARDHSPTTVHNGAVARLLARLHASWIC